MPVCPTLFWPYEKSAPLLVGVVVGWCALYVLVAIADNQQVAVLYACDELYIIVAEMLIKILYQHVAFLRGEVSSMVVFYQSVGEIDDITPHGHVIRSHLVAYGSGLERTASLIHVVEVVAENGSVGDLTSRVKSIGYRNHTATATHPCELVHIWSVGVLQQSLSAESLYGMVGHAVA